MLDQMRNAVSTITSKWQVTIPEDVRKELPFKIGQRIAWEADGDKLIGRRVRSIVELSGVLKSPVTLTKEKGRGEAFARAAISRHDRISKQKP
jgi:bifunctional DNA-binding transcriptional regulator/antitoxin component of YhaV-PrlF toxin-antitoxin module